MFGHSLKSKIHRATVTHCELRSEGSCAIDDDLLEASDGQIETQQPRQVFFDTENRMTELKDKSAVLQARHE